MICLLDAYLLVQFPPIFDQSIQLSHHCAFFLSFGKLRLHAWIVRSVCRCERRQIAIYPKLEERGMGGDCVKWPSDMRRYDVINGGVFWASCSLAYIILRLRFRQPELLLSHVHSSLLCSKCSNVFGGSSHWLQSLSRRIYFGSSRGYLWNWQRAEICGVRLSPQPWYWSGQDWHIFRMGELCLTCGIPVETNDETWRVGASSTSQRLRKEHSAQNLDHSNRDTLE